MLCYPRRLRRARVSSSGRLRLLVLEHVEELLQAAEELLVFGVAVAVGHDLSRKGTWQKQLYHER